jgi:hypothetical protein
MRAKEEDMEITEAKIRYLETVFGKKRAHDILEDLYRQRKASKELRSAMKSFSGTSNGLEAFNRAVDQAQQKPATKKVNAQPVDGGLQRSAFWGTLVPEQKAQKAPGVVIRHPFWRTETKQFGQNVVDIAGAIEAMGEALDMPQAVLDQMIRVDGTQHTYDILQGAIEASGGTVNFTVGVAR